jgi:enoyl-CoA hydratase
MGFPIARTLGNCLSLSNISRLTALIGPARVKDLIFTARLVGAEEAFAVGLLTEVVEDIPALQKRADELATLIAGNAPLTLNATKQALARLQRRLSREEGEDLILMCYMSKDFREGLDAFLTKRPPQWKGE